MATRRLAITASTLALAAGASLLLAGPLSPPAGPITTSFKTLSETEPRTIINAANTPGDNDASPSLYKITQPGSYYLSGNLQGVPGKIGIEIAASNVTIDLGGFALLGVAGSHDGILVTSASARNIDVHQGSISSWGTSGLDLGSAGDARVRDVRVSNNGLFGINVGPNAVISGCVSDANQFGFYTGPNASVLGCSSMEDLETGITLHEGCTLRDCTVLSSGGHGIWVEMNSVIQGCTVRGSGTNGIRTGDGVVVSNCAVSDNKGYGIYCPLGGSVIDCSVNGNSLDGIRMQSNGIIRGNLLNFNGYTAGSGANICITGPNNRIEANNCTNADRGLDIQSLGNFLSRNICTNNITNYKLVAGNVCTVTTAATAGVLNGSNGGTLPGNSDPNANFSY